MLARAALSGLISIVALSVAPAHSQPSGAGSSGLLSPAPLTGSGPARRFIPPDRSVAAPSSTATLPQEVEQDPAPTEQTAAPSASTPPTPGPLWTRREIAPAATRTTPKQPPRHRRTASAPQPRREAAKEVSTQKRQVRPNRLGAKPTHVRREASRGQTSTWAATDRLRATRETRGTAPAKIELAPRGEPQLPLGLMPRQARQHE